MASFHSFIERKILSKLHRIIFLNAFPINLGNSLCKIPVHTYLLFISLFFSFSLFSVINIFFVVKFSPGYSQANDMEDGENRPGTDRSLGCGQLGLSLYSQNPWFLSSWGVSRLCFPPSGCCCAEQQGPKAQMLCATILNFLPPSPLKTPPDLHLRPPAMRQWHKYSWSSLPLGNPWSWHYLPMLYLNKP